MGISLFKRNWLSGRPAAMKKTSLLLLSVVSMTSPIENIKNVNGNGNPQLFAEGQVNIGEYFQG